MFTINVKENNAVKKYICSSAKAVAAKMSELALWTKDVQISWGDDVYGTAYDAQRQIPANDCLFLLRVRSNIPVALQGKQGNARNFRCHLCSNAV